MDVGMRYSNISYTGQPNLETYMFSLNAGKSINDYSETQITGGLGSTDYYGVDDYTNFDLGWDMILKYEKVMASGSKIVPFARGGVTLNVFSNYQEHTVGYDAYYRYYTTSGTTYVDYYGNYSAGLAYIAPNEKWALSTELGTYHWLGGDLDMGDYSETFWSTHLYYKAFEESGIKLMYSYETDSEMSTYGIYWTKNF